MYRASMGAVGLTAKSSSPGEPRPSAEEQKKGRPRNGRESQEGRGERLEPGRPSRTLADRSRARPFKQRPDGKALVWLEHHESLVLEKSVGCGESGRPALKVWI